MSKEKKKLTVSEIKSISPLVDIYELSQYKKYIVCVKKPSIIGMDQLQSVKVAREIGRLLAAQNIKCALLANIDMNEVVFLEMT